MNQENSAMDVHSCSNHQISSSEKNGAMVILIFHTVHTGTINGCGAVTFNLASLKEAREMVTAFIRLVDLQYFHGAIGQEKIDSILVYLPVECVRVIPHRKEPQHFTIILKK